jgi:DNA-directed RNA polymerase subunit RPC12/RpoP
MGVMSLSSPSGTPFKCTTCGAALVWRDQPVIECDYCHAKVLVDQSTLAAKAMAAAIASRKSPTIASQKSGLWIVGAIVLVGVIGTVVKKSSSSSVKPAARVVVADEEMPEPPKPPASPPAPVSPGKQVLEFGESGTGAGQFGTARVLAVTPTGEIVVAEASTGRVQVFDGKGSYQRLITLTPDALTKGLTVLGAGATSKGEVVVSRSGDLLVLDVAAGTIARTIRGSYPDVYYHGDVEVAPDDTIYAITDRTGDMAVNKVSAAGKVIGTLKRTYAGHVAVDGVGTVFLAQADAIEVRDSKGQVLRKFSQGDPARGKLSNPGPIAYDGRGRLFVHDGSSVQIFDAEGAYLGTVDTGNLNDMALDRAGALYTLTSNKVRKYEITLPTK